MRNVFRTVFMCLMFLVMSTLGFAEEQAYQPALYATFWSLVPPVVAIVLALITKEVYSSLFLGITVGGLFYSGFTFEKTVTHILQNGFIKVLSDSYNVGILIFLVVLGAMVCLMNAAGGSLAFGTWASKKIKCESSSPVVLELRAGKAEPTVCRAKPVDLFGPRTWSTS